MKLSVVMSIYNDAATLPASIDSVLSQDFRDFEFIIVNDGSPDPRTGEILDDYARRDGRIRVITKANEGLTKALIDGCAAAQGEYIARIDVGDRFLPGRLRMQADYLEQHPEVAVVSCGTRFLTPDRDVMFERTFRESPEEATSLLRVDGVTRLRAVTHHGSTMFRRAVYEHAGGYRWQFYFAQDVDLWMRLTDHGQLAFLPEVLYEATFTPAGISGRHAAEQIRLGKLIIASRLRREASRSDDDILEVAAQIRPSGRREADWRRRRRQAKGEYFVGQILRGNGNPRCRRYFAAACRLWPLHLHAWLRRLQCALTPSQRVAPSAP